MTYLSVGRWLEASASCVCGKCVSSWYSVNVGTSALLCCRRVYYTMASAGSEIPSD